MESAAALAAESGALVALTLGGEGVIVDEGTIATSIPSTQHAGLLTRSPLVK